MVCRPMVGHTTAVAAPLIVEAPFDADAGLVGSGVGFEGDIGQDFDLDSGLAALFGGTLFNLDIDIVVQIFAGFQPAVRGFFTAYDVQRIDIEGVPDCAEGIEATTAAQLVQGEGQLGRFHRADFTEFPVEQQPGQDLVLGKRGLAFQAKLRIFGGAADLDDGLEIAIGGGGFDGQERVGR